jgi:hypothetical protein
MVRMSVCLCMYVCICFRSRGLWVAAHGWKPYVICVCMYVCNVNVCLLTNRAVGGGIWLELLCDVCVCVIVCGWV